MIGPMVIDKVISSLFNSLVGSTIKKVWERLRPKKKPLVEDGYVSLTFYEPKVSKRLAKIRFTITNRDSKKCSIQNVILHCSLPIPKVNLVSINRWPKGDLNTDGVQKLPLVLPIDEPIQVFIHTENSDNRYMKEQYPDVIEMQIILSHIRKPLTTLLLKQSDGHQYKQE